MLVRIFGKSISLFGDLNVSYMNSFVFLKEVIEE